LSTIVSVLDVNVEMYCLSILGWEDQTNCQLEIRT